MCLLIGHTEHSESIVLLVGQIVGVLQQTHINTMEVNTPVGSSPGGNKAIAMLARRGQGGAGGCQSSHCSHSFLHEGKRRESIF